MPDLADGETFKMQGSGSKPYELKNTGGVITGRSRPTAHQMLIPRIDTERQRGQPVGHQVDP